MAKNADLSFIDKIEELCAVPSLMMDVMNILNSPGASVYEIKEKIELDPALTAFLLRYCNFASYGLPSKVNSISRAIALLGSAYLKSILMSYFLRNIYKAASTKKHNSNYLWKHSLYVAYYAKFLAEHLKSDPEDAYVAGLLHDIGKMVFYFYKPEAYKDIMKKVEGEGKSFLTLENETFRYSHVETGYYLMNKWGLSDLLKDSVRYHHDFQDYPGSEKIIGLVAFANSASHCLFEKPGILPEVFLELLGIEEEESIKINEEVTQSLEKVQSLFMD